MHTVLVALDETEASKRAAEFVNDFFDADTTRIFGLNVAATQVPWIPTAPYGYVWAWPYPAYGMAAVTGDVEEQAREAERQAEETVLASGIQDAETIVEQGDPATAIAQAAEDRDVDLIVVGSRDEGALKRLLFGSVSDDLVHHAPRPVLVVR